MTDTLGVALETLLSRPTPGWLRPTEGEPGEPREPGEGPGLPLAPDYMEGKELEAYCLMPWRGKLSRIGPHASGGGGMRLAFGVPPYSLWGLLVTPALDMAAGRKFPGALRLRAPRGAVFVFSGSGVPGVPEGHGGRWLVGVPEAWLAEGGPLDPAREGLLERLDPRLYPELDGLYLREPECAGGLEPPALARQKEIARLMGMSKETFRRHASMPGFPKPVTLGRCAVYWPRWEVQDWFLARRGRGPFRSERMPRPIPESLRNKGKAGLAPEGGEK
ncbi:MAG: AlpA family phage regulatory protein [Deltaproteobacteria bacterium]|jgi:predicted DNA-binding transcriptional regulator AlpA|nr:AlpA family phage regulatory protein [Deltaproteobacteria bacterium]